MQASLRGGGERIPGEVAWRGLSAQAQGVAVPSSPGECRDPRSRSTCRAGPGSRAARERIRARIRARSRGRARAQPPSLASHPPQSSFTKLSDFLSPKRVSWGEETRASPFLPLLLPPGSRAWCPPRICDSIHFSLHSADVLRGVGEGGPVWGAQAARRGVGWGAVKRRSEVSTLGSLFQIGI